jgi:hypothetical protein
MLRFSNNAGQWSSSHVINVVILRLIYILFTWAVASYKALTQIWTLNKTHVKIGNNLEKQNN